MIFFFCPSLWSTDTKQLEVGESWVVQSSIQILADQNQGVLGLENLENGVRLRARKAGVVPIKYGGKIVTVEVLSWRQTKTRRILGDALKTTMGMALQVAAGKVGVSGQLLRWADWESLASACQDQCAFEMRAEIPTHSRLIYQRRINDRLSELNLPPQRLQFAPNATRGVFIQIQPGMEEEKALRDFFDNYGVEVKISKSAIRLVPMVELAITVAEVRKDAFLNYGLQWASTFQTQVMPDVKLLEQEGAGRILATPKIICRSGESADFFAGGEFPIKILKYKMQDVIWKKYGIQLKAKPLVELNGKISLTIDTEISSIDKSKTVDGIPAMFSNRIQSHINLLHSQSLVLSGLLKAEDSESAEGLPGLSSLPILGPLFSSKDFRTSQTQLLIVVTPRLIPADGDI